MSSYIHRKCCELRPSVHSLDGLIVEFHGIDRVSYKSFLILLLATYLGIQHSKNLHLKRSCSTCCPSFAFSLHMTALLLINSAFSDSYCVQAFSKHSACSFSASALTS